MPKLPFISANSLIKVFKRLDFEIVSQKGSHIKMRHADGRNVIIPNHKIIKKGTLKKGILNPMGISVDGLIKLLD